MILTRRLPAVFVESAVAPRTLESLVEPCRAAGHDLQIGGELFADALGPHESPAGTYEGMIRHNVDTIVAALAGEAQAEAP
jgi:manganese/zinc/iron transport system substrate-binding protein